MDLKRYLPADALEYIECFRKLAVLTNAAMDFIEHKTLVGVAESAETLSLLRGDSGAYYDARPEGLIEYQDEMYAIEEQLRVRLLGLGYKYPSLA